MLEIWDYHKYTNHWVVIWTISIIMKGSRSYCHHGICFLIIGKNSYTLSAHLGSPGGAPWVETWTDMILFFRCLKAWGVFRSVFFSSSSAKNLLTRSEHHGRGFTNISSSSGPLSSLDITSARSTLLHFSLVLGGMSDFLKIDERSCNFCKRINCHHAMITGNWVLAYCVFVNDYYPLHVVHQWLKNMYTPYP